MNPLLGSRASKRPGRILATLVAIPLFAGASGEGCQREKKADATATATTATSADPAGTITSADPTKMYLRAKPSDLYTTYSHEHLSFTTACSIAKDANVDLMCFIDAEEYDLYFNGLSVQFAVPPGMCPYVKYMTPYYYKYSGGTGPALVKYYTNAAGAIVDENNSVNGAAVCSYDYRGSGGPNCCEGTYSKVVGAYNTATSAVAYGSPVVTAWGGKASNCLGGPGIAHQKLSPVTGRPMYEAVYSQVAGFTRTIDVVAPITQSFNSNLAVANYFFLADYFNVASALPRAFKPTVAPSDAAGPPVIGPYAGTLTTTQASPYFEFVCMNRNEDVISRIRMMVRSWDTAGYLDLTRAYAFYEANVPNGGNESATFPDYNGSLGSALHDRKIWGEVEAEVAGFNQGMPRSSE